MVHWSCASPLCYNNYNTKTPYGENINYHRIPPKLLKDYCTILKISGLEESHEAYVCCEHWSSGLKRNYEELPDVIVPPSQLQKHKDKYKKLCKDITALKNPLK